jgi:hypothetical protein
MKINQGAICHQLKEERNEKAPELEKQLTFQTS